MKTDTLKTILMVARRLDSKGIVNAYEGNISSQKEGLLYITPTAQNKGLLTEEMIAVLNENQEQVAGNNPPSSEVLMHFEVYRLREDVGGIVHAHPPFLTAYALANQSIKSNAYAELLSVFGEFPCIPYGRPGTKNILSQGHDILREHNVMLLGNHGALAVGEDVIQAMNRMEAAEAIAKIITLAQWTGGAKDLPASEIDYLLSLL